MRIQRCRSCGGRTLLSVVDLGEIPLANALRDTREEAMGVDRYPLEVVRCPACTLMQILEAPSPQTLFGGYPYYSSQSRTMCAHAMRLVEQYVQAGDRVVEIASNDGYLLGPAMARGAEVLGVEPAETVAAAARQRGVKTEEMFFDANAASALRSKHGEADVIFALNVVAHVPDPNEVMEGIARLLAPHGRAHIEVPSLVELLRRTAFDTIYHEHHSYFSLTALDELCERHGLRIADCELIEIHGGSLHVEIGRASDVRPTPRVSEMLERETKAFREEAFRMFAARIDARRKWVRKEIEQHRPCAAYGAAAKGVVLLNVFGLDHEWISCVADISPHKQGRFIPGTGQPIISPEQLAERDEDMCLILPWNLMDEIGERLNDFVAGGGLVRSSMPESMSPPSPSERTAKAKRS